MIQIPAPVRMARASAGPSSSAKAGPVGPGAGVLMTEYGLTSVLGNNEQDRMAKYLKMANEVDWIRAAERIIAGRIAGCAWHIEDPDGDTIDEEYDGSPLAVELYESLKYPQKDLPLKGPDGVGKRQSRRQQLTLTSRHMGAAGTGAWFFDRLDGNGCPHAFLYIRPDRLTPQYSKKNGVLIGWQLDVRPGDPGTPLPLEQVLLFQLQPPDEGVFGPGLIESSMAKAVNNGLVDRHYTALLRSGGRISGILAPKEGAITDDNVYNQMVRDWRNVTEQPESARRLQIVRAPVEFQSTVQSVGEMQIIDLMYHNRDALLALWGVPLSMLGGATSSGGLNSGDSRQYDEAALWQGAVQDRLDEITEGYQAICDLWEEAIGFRPKFCFDPPTFDDDLPNYEKIKNSAGLAMRNAERRALVGLDPFGDERLDNAIWMPVNVVAMAMSPDENGNMPEGDVPGIRQVTTRGIGVDVQPGTDALSTPAVDPKAAQTPGAAPAPAAARSGQRMAPAVKAVMGASMPYRVLDVGTVRLRESMEQRLLPRMTDAVQAALDAQRKDVAARIVRNWDAIVRHKGNDETMFWSKKDDEYMDRALRPAISGIQTAVEEHIDEAFGG